MIAFTDLALSVPHVKSISPLLFFGISIGAGGYKIHYGHDPFQVFLAIDHQGLVRSVAQKTFHNLPDLSPRTPSARTRGSFP